MADMTGLGKALGTYCFDLTHGLATAFDLAAGDSDIGAGLGKS